MPVRFAVIGAGPLGTAAAYDLARYGDADEVRILDLVIGRAQAAADRINRLVRRKVAKAGVANAAEPTGTSQVLEGLDGVVAAGPAHLHPTVAEAAIRACVHYTDLGGAAPEVLMLHERAKAARISVVPDCGAAPGLANLLVAHGMGRMDAPHAVRVRSGDLPESPDLPLGYQPHFTVEALARRYFGTVAELKDGERVDVPVFSNLESVDVPPLGQLEAFSTGGGCDTCPQTYASRLTHFDFKTLRYPGHHQALSLLTHLGFLSRDPVTIKGQAVVPLHVFQAVMGRLWNRPEVADIYVLRVEVDGTHHGRPAHYAATLVERSDKADTGFTAIQRCTGFGAGAMMSALVAGRAMPGAWPPERVVEPAVVLDGLRDRGLNIVEKQRVDAPEHQNSSHRSSS